MTENNYQLQFLKFLEVNETDINQYKPLAGSFAVVQCKDKYLLCFNKWRKQWELPAGKQEENETSKECAVRELYEETGQEVSDLKLKGLLKVMDKKKGYVKYNPVYMSSVTELQPFNENEETSQILLWNKKDDIGYIDSVDLKILDFV